MKLWIAKLNATRRRHKKGASWFVAGYINSVQTNNQVMNQGTQTHSTSIGSKGKHITFSERQLIERWVREKKSTAQIASLLARHRITIYRELKRGRVKHLDSELREYFTYSAQFAQERCDEQRDAHGPSLKIACNHQLAARLAELLGGKLKHSPFAARQLLLKAGYDVSFSARTIYNYVHNGVIAVSAQHMVYGPRKKRKKPLRKRLAHSNTGALSIEQRPSEVDKRSQIGHFEMDCVVGPSRSHAALLVLTERVTRFQLIYLMRRKTSQNVVHILNRIERRLGPKRFASLFLSITTDNGCEFSDSLAICTSCITGNPRTIHYSTHPYCASERGSNENANRFIRRFFPKGTDFSRVSQKTLSLVALWMNRYPRLLFNGLSSWHMAKSFRHYFNPLSA